MGEARVNGHVSNRAKRAPGQLRCKLCGVWGGAAMISTPCKVTPEIKKALLHFAACHGRLWKSLLKQDWDGDVRPELRQARNIIGPSGLAKLKLEWLKEGGV